jgi:hypothetical protein
VLRFPIIIYSRCFGARITVGTSNARCSIIQSVVALRGSMNWSINWLWCSKGKLRSLQKMTDNAEPTQIVV